MECPSKLVDEVVEMVGAKSLMDEARGLEASGSADAGGYEPLGQRAEIQRIRNLENSCTCSNSTESIACLEYDWDWLMLPCQYNVIYKDYNSE